MGIDCDAMFGKRQCVRLGIDMMSMSGGGVSCASPTPLGSGGCTLAPPEALRFAAVGEGFPGGMAAARDMPGTTL